MLVGGKPWADGPYPLCETQSWDTRDENEHSCIKMALEMLRPHNTFIRAFNSILLQGPLVSTAQDKADLMIFCHSLVTAIHHHHRLEETILFPHIERVSHQPGLMSKNVEQHHVFEAGIDEFDRYVTSTTGDNMQWESLKAVMDAFVPQLMVHLNEEIVTLRELMGVDSKELWKGWEATEKEALKCLDGDATTDFVPLVLGCADRTFENGLHKSFPPVPFFVPYLVRWFWSKKHKGAWRFNPCDEWGQPRPLEFIKSA